jgi:hypothetical protein
MENIRKFFVITIAWALLMMLSHVSFHVDYSSPGDGKEVPKHAVQRHNAHSWLENKRRTDRMAKVSPEVRANNLAHLRATSKEGVDVDDRANGVVPTEEELDAAIAIKEQELKQDMNKKSLRRAMTKDEQMDSALHIVFSTDCTPYQDWQALLVFHSAFRVGQLGRLTRIASGCTEDKKLELSTLYAKLWPRNSVHFTPDYTRTESGEKYEFYNKPYGMLDFLTNGINVDKDAIIAIIDPDFLFMRPLTRRISGRPENIPHSPRRRQPQKEFDYIDKGHPAGQVRHSSSYSS